MLLPGARDDDLCRIEGYEKLYERAREPKKPVVLPITHYEIYGGKWLDESSRLACKWFERFLKQELLFSVRDQQAFGLCDDLSRHWSASTAWQADVAQRYDRFISLR